MSESEYQELVERMLENTSVPMISSDTGLEAAHKMDVDTDVRTLLFLPLICPLRRVAAADFSPVLQGWGKQQMRFASRRDA
jgi:hypothetical protein